MFTLTITAHFTDEQLPDADTDVLVWEQDQPEAQLGAYVGHDEEGPLWVNAHGDGIKVVAWAALPVAALAPKGACEAAREALLLAGGEAVDLRGPWRLPG